MFAKLLYDAREIKINLWRQFLSALNSIESNSLEMRWARDENFSFASRQLFSEESFSFSKIRITIIISIR